MALGIEGSLANQNEKLKILIQSEFSINMLAWCQCVTTVQGGGMGPAHDPHVLWLQLGLSSFFLQRWTQALDVFTRIMQGVAQASMKSPAPI